MQGLDDESSPEAKFLTKTRDVLKRESKGHIPDVLQDYVITCLEVDFQERDSIGEGAFGRVFKGQWNGAVCGSIAQFIHIQIIFTQPVAIKQMYSDDARTLTENDRKVNFLAYWAK